MAGMLMRTLGMGLPQCTEVLMVATLAMANNTEVIPKALTAATVSSSNMHRVLHILPPAMDRYRQLHSQLQFLSQTRLPLNKYLHSLKCKSSSSSL